jgi:alkylation response protein AidB-like acyl-CoA dehydrogenase
VWEENLVDLLMTAEQRQIVDSVTDFLSENLPVERLRPNAATRQENAVAREMAELGWYMIGLEESHGGLGMSVTEEALVFREFGRYLLGPSALATVLAMRVAATTGLSELCHKMADGTTQVALANPVSGAQLGATVSGQFHVFDGTSAEILLMIGEDGSAALVSRNAVSQLETRRSAVDGMTLEHARCDATPAVASIAAGSDIYVRLSLLSAAMLSGICEGSRDLATEYAKIRVQFGRPIGSFQAIKHKCSDMALRADAACNLVNFSAVTLAAGQSDAAYLCTASKLLAARYALLSAKEAIQVHGGIGYTVECNAHHFLKRAHLYDLIGGSSFRQQQLLLADATQLPELAA